MIIDKERYFQISKENNLPKRCPILNICERRAMSVYFLSYIERDKGNMLEILKKHKEISDDFEKKMISIQGESPTLIKGNSSQSFSGFCPEVSLFDNNHNWGAWEKLHV